MYWPSGASGDSMATGNRLLSALTGLAALATALAAAPADWPNWTGPLGRNAADTGALPGEFDRDSRQNVRWSARLGEVAFGSPTVSQGKVFVGTNMAALRGDPRFEGLDGGVLVCLDEATGERLWSVASPVRTEGFPEGAHMIHQRWGLCSSPTVDGDRVYVVTNGNDLLCLDVEGLRNGNDGPFQDEAVFMAGEGRAPIALNPETDGDILWRYDIPRALEVAPHDTASSSVLIHGDVLYAATSNGIGVGSPVYALNREAPAFIALDKGGGTFLAREDVALSENLFHAQWGSATKAEVGGETLIFLGGNDGVCYAFEAIPGGDGGGAVPDALATRWRFDCNPPHYQRYLDGRPIYYYQGDLRVYRNKVRAGESVEGFNSGDGSFVGPSEILASPVFYEGRVYVATGRDPLHGLGRGALSCIDATGAGDISESGLVWRFEGIGRTMSTVAIADGLVYAADLAGTLYCLDAGMGVLYWKHDTGHEIWGNPLVADGKVYVNTKHSFWVFAAGRRKEVLFSSRGGSETGPIAANGVVYAFIRGQLYALSSAPVNGLTSAAGWR